MVPGKIVSDFCYNNCDYFNDQSKLAVDALRQISGKIQKLTDILLN